MSPLPGESEGSRTQASGAEPPQNIPPRGLEEAGRAARYDFFQRAMERSGGELLALGHQNNDLAEDILMRLMRGAGWPGLSGMAGFDPRRRLARPLLLTPRARLEEFVRALGLVCVDDASNQDQRFLRNRVRHRLLPLFLAENPAFLEQAVNLWRLGRLDAELFDELLHPKSIADGYPSEDPSRYPQERPDAAPLSPGLLASLPKALRLRLYKERLDALGPGQAQLTGLFALDAAWQNRPEPSEHRFAGGKRAFVRRRGIRWEKK